MSNIPRFCNHLSICMYCRVAHSAPTFMADYEMPSGGDWSIHRGGAVFLDGTEDITIENLNVDQAGRL
jgi:hypothetical protein